MANPAQSPTWARLFPSRLRRLIRARSSHFQHFYPVDQLLEEFGDRHQLVGKDMDHFGIKDKGFGIRGRSTSADHLVDLLLGGVCGSSQLVHVFLIEHGSRHTRHAASLIRSKQTSTPKLGEVATTTTPVAAHRVGSETVTSLTWAVLRISLRQNACRQPFGT